MKASTFRHKARRGRLLPRVAAVLAIFTAIFASNVPTPLYAVWQAE